MSPELQAEDDKKQIQRIYGEWLWSIKIRRLTYETLGESIDKAILRVEQEIHTPALKEMAIQKFTEARNRLSEFTV